MNYYMNKKGKKTFQNPVKMGKNIKSEVRRNPIQKASEWFLICLFSIKGIIKIYQTLTKRNPVLQFIHSNPSDLGKSIFGKILSSGFCNKSMCILFLYTVKGQEQSNLSQNSFIKCSFQWWKEWVLCLSLTLILLWYYM